MENGGFGIHILIDVDDVGNVDLLTSRLKALEFTNQIVSIAKMTAVGPPMFYAFPVREIPLHTLVEGMLSQEPDLEDQEENLSLPYVQPPCNGDEDSSPGGYSLVQILAESHLSIHTYPSRGALSFDFFSCSSFDADAVVEFVKAETCGAAIFKHSVIKRTFHAS